MVELDFMVPPQIVVGEGRHVVDVTVTAGASRTGARVTVILSTGQDGVLTRVDDVPRLENRILEHLEKVSREVGVFLDGEAARRKKLRGY